VYFILADQTNSNKHLITSSNLRADSPPTSADIKNEWIYSSTALTRLHVVRSDNFIFTFSVADHTNQILSKFF